MSILIGNYEFDGPYDSIREFKDESGLYAVLHCDGAKYELIYLAESNNLKESIEMSPSAENLPDGSTLIATYYTEPLSDRERREMVDEILKKFDDGDSKQFGSSLRASLSNT